MFYDKYKAIAYRSPVGIMVDKKVLEQWDTWVQILDKNNILNIFKKCGYQGTLDSCAEDIYVAAIWGYGVSNWVEGQKDPENFCIKNFFSGRSGSYIKLSRGINNTPLWFYLLDQWLESLCRDLSNDILSLNEKNSDC